MLGLKVLELFCTFLWTLLKFTCRELWVNVPVAIFFSYEGLFPINFSVFQCSKPHNIVFSWWKVDITISATSDWIIKTAIQILRQGFAKTDIDTTELNKEGFQH